MCDCFDRDYIGSDPSCEVHGKGGYIDQVDQLQQKLSDAESDIATIRNAITAFSRGEIDLPALLACAGLPPQGAQLGCVEVEDK